MRAENSIGQALRRDGCQGVRCESLSIGSVICVEPCPLDTGYIRQPGNWASIFVLFDEIGKVAPVFEQQRGGWRSGAHVETCHGAEEILSRDAFRCWKRYPKGVDEADGDVVAINIVSLHYCLGPWPGHRSGRRAVWTEQRPRKQRCVRRCHGL